MRCPKCHYISFDGGDRCRNCGYDFALVVDLPDNDLSMRGEAEAFGPPADLSLNELDTSRTPPAEHEPGSPADATLEKNRRPPSTGSFDLPLFKGQPGRTADRPLVASPVAPRPPLAVRRPTPEVSRHRPRAARPARRAPRLQFASRETVPGSAAPVGEDTAAAGGLRRMLAAVIDGLVLSGLDLAVVYLTLKLNDLTMIEASLLPKVPVVAFLLLLDGGYLVGFTAASGQTIGKMAMAIRVVGMTRGSAVTIGQAALRAAGSLLSLATLGLGCLPALVAADRRALHDRLAHTRVVKVS